MSDFNSGVVKSTLAAAGLVAFSLAAAYADGKILIADCANPNAQSATVCNDDGLPSYWDRSEFMAALGAMISDADGTLNELTLIGQVINLDGEMFLAALGANPLDAVSVFLNGIDLAAVSVSGVQNLIVEDLGSQVVTEVSGSVAADVNNNEVSKLDLDPVEEKEMELELVDPVISDAPIDDSPVDEPAVTPAEKAETYDFVSRLTSGTIDQLYECRALASRSIDGGVEIGDVDAETAMTACEPVARVLVNEPEVQFLYGRALDASGLQGAAIDVYQTASNLGSAKADASLGRLYLETTLDARATLAAGALQRGVERDDPVAAFRLYSLLAESGRDEDVEKSKRLLKAATLAAYVPAILESARLAVAAPDQTELTDQELEDLLLLAADNGDAQSKSFLGRQWIINEDPRREEAIGFLRDASGEGDKQAASTLGLLLLSGDVEALEGDNPRELLEISVDESNATVKSALAALILTQDGLEADKERVVSLLSQAAAEGDAGSATNLGTFYRTGLFVQQSMDTAARWYLIGLSMGSQDFSEQIFGYAPWDERGSAGLTAATKAYLDGLGLLEGPIDDETGSELAKAVTKFLLEVDAIAEGAKLIEERETQ